MRIPRVGDQVRTTKVLQTINEDEETIDVPIGALCEITHVDLYETSQGLQFTLHPMEPHTFGVLALDEADPGFEEDGYPFDLID